MRYVIAHMLNKIQYTTRRAVDVACAPKYVGVVRIIKLGVRD